MTFFITALIAILPLWLLQNTIHELSHGLTIWLGWKWKFSIWPFPSNRLGRFTFSHIIYEQTKESKEIDNDGWALIVAMPKIVNALFILLGYTIAIVAGSPILSAIFIVFCWCNCIDFFAGFVPVFRGSPKEADLMVFMEKLNIPLKNMKIAGYACLIYMAMLPIIGTLICV